MYRNSLNDNLQVLQIDKFRKYFLGILVVIVAVGIIMVYSSSYMFAKELFGGSTHFFFRQIIFVVVGSLIAFLIGKTKFTFWIKYGHYINIFFTAALILTFVPGIGVHANGANRWIGIGGLTFQPGEMVKFTIIISALYLFENFPQLGLTKKILIAISLIFPLGLLIVQPDYGSFLICYLAVGFVCLLTTLSSNKFRYFLMGHSLIGILGVGLLFIERYRFQRLLTYLDPWKNPKTSGFQLIQSFLAFANGSFFGQGIGNSTQKLFYLPEAHNDFLFSVIGEELGFVGVFVVVMLFVMLIYFGIKLALLANSRFGLILISSVIFVVAIQTLLNMGVVLGLLPTKGLNLPFVSYGGSSLISNFFGIGLILSVLRQTRGLAGTTTID